MQVCHCEFVHFSYNGPFGCVMMTIKLPDDDTRGVPKHVAELIKCEEYI